MFGRVYLAVYLDVHAFGFLGLVTFSEEQTNLTVCSRGQIERCRKEGSIGVR